MNSVPFDNSVVLDLGFGFDSILGVPKESMITFDPNAVTRPEQAAAKTSFRYVHLTHETELSETFQLSASAAFGTGPYSASGSLNMFRTAQRTSFREYLLACVDVELERVYIRDPKIKDAGKEEQRQTTDVHQHASALQPESERRKQLREKRIDFDRYGDKFVNGVVKGGSFWVLFDCSTDSVQEQQQLRGAFSAATPYGSGSASVESTLKRSEQNKKLSIEIVRYGPQSTLPELTVEAITNYMREYPETLRSTGGYWTNRYLLADYPFHLQNVPIEGRQILRRLIRAYLFFNRRRADLQAIRDTPSEFAGVDFEILSGQIQYITALVFEIRDLVQWALESPVDQWLKELKAAADKHLQAAVAFDTPPGRIAWTGVNAREKQGTLVTVTRTGVGEKKYVFVTGSWSHYEHDNDDSGRKPWHVPGVVPSDTSVYTELLFNGVPQPHSNFVVTKIPDNVTVQFRFVDGNFNDNRGDVNVGVFTPVHDGTVDALEPTQPTPAPNNGEPASQFETTNRVRETMFTNRRPRRVYVQYRIEGQGGIQLDPGETSTPFSTNEPVWWCWCEEPNITPPHDLVWCQAQPGDRVMIDGSASQAGCRLHP